MKRPTAFAPASHRGQKLMVKPSSLLIFTGLALNLAGAALMCSRLAGLELDIGVPMDTVPAGAAVAILGLFGVIAGVALSRRKPHHQAAVDVAESKQAIDNP